MFEWHFPVWWLRFGVFLQLFVPKVTILVAVSVPSPVPSLPPPSGGRFSVAFPRLVTSLRGLLGVGVTFLGLFVPKATTLPQLMSPRCQGECPQGRSCHLLCPSTGVPSHHVPSIGWGHPQCDVPECPLIVPMTVPLLSHGFSPDCPLSVPLGVLWLSP